MKRRIIRAMGQRLRDTREEMGMTQMAFAEKMGIVNSHLSAIEAGRSGPGFYFFYQVSQHHKINPVYLLHGVKPIFLDGVLEEEPPPPEPPSDEYGENTSQIRKMLSYIKRSQVVKFAVLGFFSKFIVENKTVIEEDLVPPAEDTSQ